MHYSDVVADMIAESPLGTIRALFRGRNDITAKGSFGGLNLGARRFRGRDDVTNYEIPGSSLLLRGSDISSKGRWVT